MTTLVDYTDELKASIAMDDDDSVTLMRRGVNAGLITAALMYEPPELRTSVVVDADTTPTPFTLTNELTRYLRVETVYNSTRDCKVWPIDFDRWHAFYFPSSGYVTYYSIHGNILYYKPTPASTESLYIYYLQYPARVTNDEDTVPLDVYQDFIISFATAYVWASKEEQEDVDIWQKVSSALNVPFQTLTQARKILRKEVPSDDYIQRTVSKSSS